MLTPELCEKCKERKPSVHTTYQISGHEIRASLCDSCARDGVPRKMLDDKIARLPQTQNFQAQESKKIKVYVVVEIQERDDYYANQPEKKPIAVFLNQKNARQYIEAKRSEGYLKLDWEMVETPLGDFNPKVDYT